MASKHKNISIETKIQGGYYGLVVVTPPGPPRPLCERDNLKNPERIASIFYM